MMLEAAIVSFVIAILRGALANKSELIIIKGWYLFILGLLTQLLPDIFALFQLDFVAEKLKAHFNYLHLISYLFILATLLINIKLHSIKLILAGTLMNIMVIFSNSSFMPVSKQAILSINPSKVITSVQLDYKHILIDSKTNLTLFADIIAVPSWYPVKQVFSIGDIFIALGVFVLIQKIFCINKSSRNRMG